MAKLELLKHFIKNPGMTGTVFPSSAQLAQTVISLAGLNSAGSVVELGPGSGAFTAQILKEIRQDTKFFAIELNKDIYKSFTAKFPGVKTYNESASELKDILVEEKLFSVDVIISGLPWASFSTRLQNDIMKAISESLSDGGIFATYAYIQGFLMPGAYRLRTLLKKYFSEVKTSKIVWCNIPPAFVYGCRK